MTRSLQALAAALVVAIAATGSAAQDQPQGSPPAKVADLAWMTGHWEGPMGRGTLEENWTEPKNGSIASLVRGTSGEQTSMIELIVIEEEGGSLVLRVQQWNPGFEPRSEKPQVMKLVASSENAVEFVATSDGGLKRLGYSRPAPDRFVVKGVTPQGAEFELPLVAKK